MGRNRWITALLMASALCAAGGSRRALTVDLRTRVEPFKGSGEWAEVHVSRELVPARTAVVICDMWDNHWCHGATERVGVLVKKMNPVIDRARESGIIIIHAPSETMDFYANQPQRLIMSTFPAVKAATELTLSAPPLPVDSADGGCDTPGDHEHKAWSREHPGLHLAASDYISDNGAEIYNLLRARGVDTLLVMGVHANMCILDRSFAIRQMTKWGIHCILVRDLTDAMYDPQDSPFVSHAAGTELVIEHIEKYWAPSMLSTQLLAALAK